MLEQKHGLGGTVYVLSTCCELPRKIFEGNFDCNFFFAQQTQQPMQVEKNVYNR